MIFGSKEIRRSDCRVLQRFILSFFACRLLERNPGGGALAGRRNERSRSTASTPPVARRSIGAAVMATFAMGTALGDLTAITLHLGYLLSAVLDAGLMLIPALGFWLFGMNA